MTSPPHATCALLGLACVFAACANIWGFDDLRVGDATGGGMEMDGTTGEGAAGDSGLTDAMGQETGDGGADGQSGADATGAQALPHSCLDIHDAGIDANGTYVIDIDGPGPDPAFAVYCNDMNTEDPLEYLELPANAEAGLSGSNFSGLITVCSGGTMTTTIFFTKVRLVVPSLTIDRTDLTFAQVTSDGGPPNGDPRTLLYASAGSCIAGGDMSGQGNADLTGTPFQMTDVTTFVPVGYLPACMAVFSADRKSVSLSGGGYAGWCDVLGADGGVGAIGVDFAP